MSQASDAETVPGDPEHRHCIGHFFFGGGQWMVKKIWWCKWFDFDDGFWWTFAFFSEVHVNFIVTLLSLNGICFDLCICRRFFSRGDVRSYHVSDDLWLFYHQIWEKGEGTEMSLEEDVQLEVRMDEGHVFEGGWQVSWYLLHVA